MNKSKILGLIAFALLFTKGLSAQAAREDSLHVQAKEIKVKSKLYLGNYSLYYGLGTLFQTGYSYRYDQLYLAGRHYFFADLSELFTGALSGAHYKNEEYALLVGWALPLKYKFGRQGYAAISTGISYNILTRPGEKLGYEHYENKETTSYGIPLDLSNTLRFGIFAISTNIALTYVLDQKEIIAGIFLNLHLGDFRDKYKIRNQRMQKMNKAELAKKLNSDKRIKGYVYNASNAIQFSFNNTSFRFAYHRFRLWNYHDLIIPFQFASAKADELYRDKFLLHTEISCVMRHWLNDENQYWLAIGPKFTVVEAPEKGTTQFIFINASIGTHYNIYKNLYISSKLDIDSPITGMKDFRGYYAGKTYSNQYLRMNIELLNIGFQF